MPKVEIPNTTTLESNAYLSGMLNEFQAEVGHYQELSGKIMEFEARLELTEKKLSLIREHLAMAIRTTEGSHSSMFAQFVDMSSKVRFVGVRLVDACTTFSSPTRN